MRKAVGTDRDTNTDTNTDAHTNMKIDTDACTDADKAQTKAHKNTDILNKRNRRFAPAAPHPKLSPHSAGKWAEAKTEVALPALEDSRSDFFFAPGATSIFACAVHCAVQWGDFFANGATSAKYENYNK